MHFFSISPFYWHPIHRAEKQVFFLRFDSSYLSKKRDFIDIDNPPTMKTNDPNLQVETSGSSLLLHQLQLVWDEVGESDSYRDQIMFEIEQECLAIYTRMLEQANSRRAQLCQTIFDSNAQLASIYSTLGEETPTTQSDCSYENLNKQLDANFRELEEMKKMMNDRRDMFIEVLTDIQHISNELHNSSDSDSSSPTSHPDVDENDLSLRRLEELQRELMALLKEKSDRLGNINNQLDTLNALCSVLGMDFKTTANEVHSSLTEEKGTKNVNDATVQKLETTLHTLREVKLQRIQRIQDLATSMFELWNLMDTPVEEQQMFENVTCNIAASENEITDPNMLSLESINRIEAEVLRLEELKASRMSNLVLKKKTELEDICMKTHVLPEYDSKMELAIETMESGNVDLCWVLEQIELQISKVREESLSRKEILEKVEKWLAASEEECWLEEYNKDENRYNAGRGTHLNLKRAEKARALMNKMPGMEETLASRIKEWETEEGKEFIYEGNNLLSMVEEYSSTRQEKEQERKRIREQKRNQGQGMADQDVGIGAKPTSVKLLSGKNSPRISSIRTGNGRSFSGLTPKADQSNSDEATTGRRGLDFGVSPLKKNSEGESPLS